MNRVPLWLLIVTAAGGLLVLLLFLRPAAPPEAGSGTAPLPSHPAPESALNTQELVGQRWLRPVGTESGYAGDPACRSCHAREFQSHAGSPHARTVHRIEPMEARPEFRSAQALRDPVQGISYHVTAANGGCRMLAESGGVTSEAEPRWAFGSGTQASTYLCPEGDRFLELRISYYSRWREWGFTPGQGPGHVPDRPLGRVYSALEAASCFGCHSTLVVGDSSRLDLARTRPNVGCEACHGPGRKHAEAAAAAAGETARGAVTADAIQGGAGSGGLWAPPRPSGQKVMELCGACHRTPQDAAGLPVSETELARLTGVALGRSRCYRESGGRLTCVTCHDPHARSATAPRAYDAACRSCHTAPHGSECRLGKTAECAGCHMAAPPAERNLPLRLHNHWIRVPGKTGPYSSSSSGSMLPESV